MKDTLPLSLFWQEHHSEVFPVPEPVEEARPTVYVQTSSLNIVGTEYGVFFLDKKGNILQHLSMNNQLQDNFVHAICVQDETRIWLALDNGITQVDINPEISILGERSKVGKPIHVALQGWPDTELLSAECSYDAEGVSDGLCIRQDEGHRRSAYREAA